MEPEPEMREIRVVGFLGVSDYGLGQLETLIKRYTVAFATAKKKHTAHASGLDTKLEKLCMVNRIPYLGSVDANSAELVARAGETDLVVIGGYDGILKKPFLEAPRHGVINTHLGLLPLNRGCCPTLWAQLHGLPQGYTTYLVGEAIDHGPSLDRYEAPASLGALRDDNRRVYDALAEAAVGRFAAALKRLESGKALKPCSGPEAYHKKGMPNDGWLSFFWTDEFLLRFSLALDFAPYLPGRTRQEHGDEIFLAILSSEAEPVPAAPSAVVPGTVLEVIGQDLTVKTTEAAVRCRLRKGPMPELGSVLASGRPESDAEGGCAHPIDADFSGKELPLHRYIISEVTAGKKTVRPARGAI
ncbi:unnamed protein product [Effrenium voratum]|nr:unnamed protein product [Effrenium voratum]